MKEDIISKLIQERIKDDKRFIMKYYGTTFVEGGYALQGLKLTQEESDIYEELLETKSKAGILIKLTGVMDGSKAGYFKNMQLMNGKDAEIHIAYYNGGVVDITTSYKNDYVNLKSDTNAARQLATELILPELDNIIRIKNRNQNKEDLQK